MGLQGEGLRRGMQSQCISCIDEGLVSVMLQPVCERSLMLNLCQVVLDSVSLEVFPDLSDVVIPAGLSHADLLPEHWRTGYRYCSWEIVS